jgi:hypothetical protein
MIRDKYAHRKAISRAYVEGLGVGAHEGQPCDSTLPEKEMTCVQCRRAGHVWTRRLAPHTAADKTIKQAYCDGDGE